LAGALGIALMSFTETMAAGALSRKAASRRCAEPGVLATGIATAAGRPAWRMPAGRRHVQTAVNRSAGAAQASSPAS